MPLTEFKNFIGISMFYGTRIMSPFYQSNDAPRSWIKNSKAYSHIVLEHKLLIYLFCTFHADLQKEKKAKFMFLIAPKALPSKFKMFPVFLCWNSSRKNVRLKRFYSTAETTGAIKIWGAEQQVAHLKQFRLSFYLPDYVPNGICRVHIGKLSWEMKLNFYQLLLDCVHNNPVSA